MPKPTTRATKLPYPALPEVGNRFFRLAWYFRKLAELEALSAHWPKMPSKNIVLRMAMIAAEVDKEHDINTVALRYVVNEGLLPFAWAGTTALEQVPA